ncbi:MAG TPA: RHS repeat-associated core domain-containing protein, partial [Ktedonobacteraceae bacterium]|nr:RHS repeat-associated core domain-containing protein [Ktedonobacteraceae bacterium]
QYQGNGINLGGTNNCYYYSLGGLLIGKFDGTNTTFFMTDGLGSVVASFSNTEGLAAVLGNQTYEPYGKARYQQGNRGTSKGYTDQYNDNLSGLDYYGARYYDPVAGVFLSPDRVQGNGSGMNPYAYVAGNPETLTDPTGQRIADCWNPQCGGFGEAGNSSITTIERPPAPSGPSSPSSSSGGPCSGWKAIICAIIAWAATHPPAQTENATNDHSSVGAATPAATPPAPWGNGDPFVNNRDMPDDISTTQGLSFPAQPAPGTIVGFVNERDVLHVQGGTACSFTSTTPVATPEGEKAIGDLQVGDKVMAYNPKTHQMEAEPVLHVWKHVDSDLIDLTITIETPAHDGKPATKQSEVIHTTSEHPFLTEEQGFVPAGQLKVGMHVRRADGSFG